MKFFFFLGSFNKKITNLLISPLPSFSETLYYIYFSAKIVLMHLYVCMIQRRLLSTLWYVETEPPSKLALWHMKMAAIRDVSWCSHQNLIFCYYSFLGWHLIFILHLWQIIIHLNLLPNKSSKICVLKFRMLLLVRSKHIGILITMVK